MSTVFVSGSRAIIRLNDSIKERLLNVIEKNISVIVGDANGSDKAFQTFFAEHGYRNVTVYCSGNNPRNNVGHWEVHPVSVDPKLTGRAFYTQKDKVMAQHTDYGLVLWDGKSAGSVSNIFELVTQNKPVAVYFSPNSEFLNIKTVKDAENLLKKCSQKDVETIARKPSINKLISDIAIGQQMALSF